MMVLLTICSVVSGYGYYKMNPHDLIPAIAFGVGLFGIMLSFSRNIK